VAEPSLPSAVPAPEVQPAPAAGDPTGSTLAGTGTPIVAALAELVQRVLATLRPAPAGRLRTYRYRVTEARVVSADDRSVLADGSGRRLAMTTCWPLWAGQLATRRLAVFAS
jgi:Sortase domain